MISDDRVIAIAQRSRPVGRLLSTSIRSAARLVLKIHITQSEADALAQAYLPSQVIEVMRKNRAGSGERGLKVQYLHRAVVSSTILDGIARAAELDLRVRPVAGAMSSADYSGRPGLSTFLHRATLKCRVWIEKLKIRDAIRTSNLKYDEAEREGKRIIGAHVHQTIVWSKRIDEGLECLQLRHEYGRRLAELDLSKVEFEEALVALDAVIDHHLTVALQRSVSSRL